MPQYEDMTILCGNANPRLAQAIASKLKVPLGRLQLIEFSNENIFVKIDESVRENDVFIVQPLSTPVNRLATEPFPARVARSWIDGSAYSSHRGWRHRLAGQPCHAD